MIARLITKLRMRRARRRAYPFPVIAQPSPVTIISRSPRPYDWEVDGE